MTAIVQITPEIGPGTGVGAVAYHLEQEWQRRGVAVSRFTLDEAAGKVDEDGLAEILRRVDDKLLERVLRPRA